MDLLKRFGFDDDEEEEGGPMELKRVRVREVSLCARPANRRPFLLYKAAEGFDENEQRIIADAISAADKGGDEQMDIQKQIEFRKAMKSADATLILGDMVEKAYGAGQLKPGDGQTAGLVALAMDAGWDFEKFMELPAGVRDAHRWDGLKGKNSYLEGQYAEASAVAKQRTAKAEADPGPGAETMRRARAMITKAGGPTATFDLADAILKVRQDDPELRERADREATGV